MAEVIEGVEVYSLEIPLMHTFATSRAIQQTGRVVIVEVKAGGLSGFGEADPRPHITGETPEGVVSILKEYLIPSILGEPIFDLEGVHRSMAAIERNPTAKSALDVALHDLLGKSVGLPVYALLGGLARSRVPLNAWCGIEEDIDSVVAILQKKVDEGFEHAAKAKVGMGENRDIELVERLGEVLPLGTDLIIDANQAWTYPEARKILNRLTDSRVTIVEQPVSNADHDGLKRLSRSLPMAVMADESMGTKEDAFKLARAEVVDMFNIKLLKCGGLHQAKKIAAVAESAGIRCMVGSTVQTSISAAAQLHLAASTPVIDYADILIPHEFLEADAASGIDLEGGVAAVSSTPGLGIEVNRDTLQKYRVG